jgi:hypothetical protein
MKYTVKVSFPHYLDIEVEADSVQEARAKALKAAYRAEVDEWHGDMFEVYEVEWLDEDGIHTII